MNSEIIWPSNKGIICRFDTFFCEGRASAPVCVKPALRADPVVGLINRETDVHELFAAMVPPERLIVLVPAVAVIVPAPQVPVKPFGVEITRPAGNVSLNATPVSATVVLLF